jgi:flagellar M-ring protein FliF
VIEHFWISLEKRFGSGGRFGLITGTLVILCAATVAGYFLLRPDYEVLFTDLSPQDTAAMTAELDHQKIPYLLSDRGTDTTAILVERSEVYKTRLKLMGKEIPLHGALGFELFNNSDFGMTDFAQKVNYQRALQGELTRTILSLAAVRDARVLLVMPEQGLLKLANNKAKASIVLALKQDQRLRPEQVTGIQRLVASAVPGISAEDVTIVDQNGVALTRSAGEGGVADTSPVRLDMKRDMEAYLSRKAGEVLDQILGPGQALASIDVTLDMDRVQSNTDEVLGAPGKPGSAPTGVVVREHETTPELSEPLNLRVGTAAYTPPAGGGGQRDIEYAISHRVEQVASQPGSIRRVQLAIVVKKRLTPAQQDQIRKTVAASVGVSPERGDTVVLQSLDGANVPTASDLLAPSASTPPVENGTPAADVLPLSGERASSAPLDRFWPSGPAITAVGSLGGLAIVLLLALLFRRHNDRNRTMSPADNLTEAQRRAALEQIRLWMRGGQAETAAIGVHAAGDRAREMAR